MNAYAKSSPKSRGKASRPVHPNEGGWLDLQPRLQLLAVPAERRIPPPVHLPPTGFETRQASRVPTRH